MKNPNGYGTVVKLSGNRRKPYAVRKTAGWNDKGQPIYINIGYTATKEEGLMMLAEYNKKPWNVKMDKITFKELFELWSEKRMPKLGKSNQQSLKAAYKHCQKLLDVPYKQIKAYHMQECIDDCGLSASTQINIKNLWWHLDKFAMELDIINKCYSELLTTKTPPETNKTIFTEDEIQRIWNNKEIPWIDSVLFLLYTGVRISEMLGLKITDINMDSDIPTFTCGVKTDAGKNRVIPIHSAIMPIVENRIEQSKGGYLFEYNGKGLLQYKNKYRKFWSDVMKQLDMNHNPHECRHTFRSRLDSLGGNRICIDRLMGHRSQGTGERVYTHKTLEELKETIELITN